MGGRHRGVSSACVRHLIGNCWYGLTQREAQLGTATRLSLCPYLATMAFNDALHGSKTYSVAFERMIIM